MQHVTRFRLGAGVLAVIVLAFSLVFSPLTGAQSTPEPGSETVATIAVNGIGTVQVDPDTARLDLGVLSNNESLEVAQTEVSEGLANITQVLTDAGVAAEDITTSSYNVYPVPEYDRDGNYVGVSRYEVSSGVSIIVRDIESVGTILDAAVEAGANNVWGISFYVDDPSDAAAQARTMAVEDARAKADQLATASGSVITRVLSINETSSPMPTPKDYYSGMGGAEMDMAAEAMPVPVSPGQTDITVTVQVIFEIEPANG
jgi:uncharacterized protein